MLSSRARSCATASRTPRRPSLAASSGWSRLRLSVRTFLRAFLVILGSLFHRSLTFAFVTRAVTFATLLIVLLGKDHPYFYTQGEAILARTYVPCQDTPAVKAPYSIRLVAPEPLVAVAAGTHVKDTKRALLTIILERLLQIPFFGRIQVSVLHSLRSWLSYKVVSLCLMHCLVGHGLTAYEYKQANPVPAYLIAFVIGHLAKAPVGPRSSVWTYAGRPISPLLLRRYLLRYCVLL